MSKEAWHKGYKETKNVIHNELGVTKEEILEVFRQIAKDEIQKIVADNHLFVKSTLREVIESEMEKAIKEHKYPKVTGGLWDYGYMGKGKDDFKNFVAGVMKEEIMKRMEEQFSVNVNIEKKD